MPDFSQLLRDAYTCNECPRSFGFSDSPNGSYFKFPPTIGAQGPADILFVGINPRRSRTNFALHDLLMTSEPAFAELSSNRRNGLPYIHTASCEPHYHDHLAVIRGVYDEPRTFESCACVTELFHCATKDSTGLPDPSSPCADKFFPTVLELTQPKAVIAVGSRVMRYFRSRPDARPTKLSLAVPFLDRDYHVVKMPHPGDTTLADDERQSQLRRCIANVRSLLGIP